MNSIFNLFTVIQVIGIIGEDETVEMKNENVVITEPNDLEGKNVDSEPSCESPESDLSTKKVLDKTYFFQLF